jgi:hypothetical protein
MNIQKIITTLSILLATSAFTLWSMQDSTDTPDMSQSTQQELLFTDNSQTEDLPEQKFMCTKKTEGTVCQMYECVNGDCRVSSPLKFNNTMTQPALIKDEALQNEAISNEMNTINLETTAPNIPANTSKETSQMLMTHINLPYQTDEEIRELQDEIRQAELSCERAESDPREKAICEDASAEVQWRKEKIRALENE